MTTTTPPFVRKLFLFPAPYPGECFYSILSRYHLLVAHTANRTTSQELFGSIPDLRPLVVLPYRIRRVEGWVDPGTGITWEKLLTQHTAWPYLRMSSKYSDTAILPIIRADGKPGRRKQSAMLRDLLGENLSLRYCPLCAKRDQALYQEPYWHLIHQLWGVHYCPFHEVELYTSKIDLSKPLHEYHPAISVDMRTTNVTGLGDKYRQQYLILSKSIQKILDSNAYEDSRRTICYIMKSLQGDDLDQVLTNTYGDEFLEEVLPAEQRRVLREGLQEGNTDAISPLTCALLVGAI